MGLFHIKSEIKQRPANSTYKKLAVQWLNEVQFFNQTFVQIDSFVLRNRQLLIAAKRYRKPYLTTLLTLNRMTLTTYSDKIGQQLTLLLRADPSEKKQKNCLRTKKFYAYAHCTHLPLPATARSQPKGKVKRVQSPTL